MTGAADRDALNAIERLQVADGDLLVLRSHDGGDLHDAAVRLDGALKAQGRNVLILLLRGDDEIVAVDEETMRRHGWVRAGAPHA